MARKRRKTTRAALSQARLHNAPTLPELPTEIWLEIILALRFDFKPAPTFTALINDVQPHPIPLTVSTRSWLPAAQVCKRWWEIACGTALLWRAIDVYKNLDWLRLCLSRSGESAAIELSFHHHSKVLEGLSVICPYKHRMTQLFLPHFPREGGPSVITFLSQGLPNLKEAIMIRDSSADEMPVLGNLKSSEMPQLAHLLLSGFPVTWALEVSSRLVSLTIQWTVPSPGSPIDLDSFLSLLEEAKSLQNLRLHEALYHGIDGTSWTPNRLISMPKLRILDVFDLPNNVRGFLSCLKLPLEVAIGVHNASPFLHDWALRLWTPSFIPLLPEDGRNIEILSSATYARIEDDHCGTITLTAKVEPYTRDYLEMSVVVLHDSNATTFVPLFDHFLQLFRHAPLATIELHGDIAQVTREKWTGLLVQFASLRTLKIGCAGSSTAFVFSALSEASADDNRSAMCPHLHSLDICKGPEITEGEIASIERCLERRKELGVDALERLSVEFKEEKERVPESTLRRDRVVNRLRELVPTVILES